MIYFDNAATTKLNNKAYEMMRAIDENYFGNPSSLYEYGRESKARISLARQVIAKCINASSDEIYFNSGASEGNNYVLRGLSCDKNHMFGFNQIITSKIEHPSILISCDILKNHFDVPFVSIGVDTYGKVNKKELLDHILKRHTSLVSIALVNHEIGTVQEIKDICDICHEYGIDVHTDATQAVGHIPIDVKNLGVDYLTASAHKFNGPKGVGFIYIKKGSHIPRPLIYGGGQENGIRSGTENVSGIVGMAEGLINNQQKINQNMKHIQGLKLYFVQKLMDLQNQIELSITINGDPLDFDNYGIGIVNFSISNTKLNGESLVLTMGATLTNFETAVCISAGSACNSNTNTASKVLMAIPGITSERAMKSIRISFSSENTTEEIDYMMEKLRYILEYLN